jgi:hypothetical protein
VKKRKKKKINYGKRNVITKLSNRLLDKDLYAYFDISKSTLYRYKMGIRKIPEHILSKAEDLLYLIPKKPIKKQKLKKKRFKNFSKKLKTGLNKISDSSNEFKFRQCFLYTGDMKDIENFIARIKAEYNDNDLVVYRIIRERIVDNKKVFDSTFMYAFHAKDKLTDNFKRLLAKYASSTQENDNFTTKIIIERTEYI